MPLPELAFYHSFPRRWRGSREEACNKGLAILDSIVCSGLLLAPERVTFRERLADGKPGPAIEVYQKRACFTQLARTDLLEHAREFGAFAIEFRDNKFRKLGANPVFYVAATEIDQGLDGIAQSIVARLWEVQELLVRLEGLQTVVDRSSNEGETLKMTRNGTVVSETRCTIAAARDLLRVLLTDLRPAAELVAVSRAMAGFFYPTENPLRTGPLHYYQQREWRIVANMMKRGTVMTHAPDERESEALLAIDPDFFGKEDRFPTGQYRRVEQCQFLAEVDGKHVLRYASAVICPNTVARKVAKMVEPFGLDVIAAESLVDV